MTYGLFYQDIPVFAFDDNVQIEQLRFIRRSSTPSRVCLRHDSAHALAAGWHQIFGSMRCGQLPVANRKHVGNSFPPKPGCTVPLSL
ncbi:hypothetical protein SAMN05216332_101510 [Nitrosospira briensis]|nr:hypothetical protein SAMN05216332_101510 [Nitrosospira briensis]